MGSSGITIASFNWRVQADLLKLHLDSLGIASWLTDEHVVGVDPLMAVAVGGIKVTVAAEDERAAREALAEFEKLREAGAGDVCLSCGAPMRESDDKCPSCGWSFNDQQ
jgi:hypothetical protein